LAKSTVSSESLLPKTLSPMHSQRATIFEANTEREQTNACTALSSRAVTYSQPRPAIGFRASCRGRSSGRQAVISSFHSGRDMGYSAVRLRRPYQHAKHRPHLVELGDGFPQAMQLPHLLATRRHFTYGRYHIGCGWASKSRFWNNPNVGLPPEHPTLPSPAQEAGYGTNLTAMAHGPLPKVGRSRAAMITSMLPCRLLRLLRSYIEERDDRDFVGTKTFRCKCGLQHRRLGSRSVDASNDYAHAWSPFPIKPALQRAAWRGAPGDEA